MQRERKREKERERERGKEARARASERGNCRYNNTKARDFGYTTKKEMRKGARSSSSAGAVAVTSTLHDAKNAIGWGKYHWILFLITGFCLMAESVEVNLLAFMSIDAAKEWHLNPIQASSIAASVFAGEIVGCSAFGIFGDRFGRKPAFILSIALIAGFGVASSFSPSVYFLVSMRFLVGVGIGGFSVPYDLLAEICPDKIRGQVLMSIWVWFAIGGILITELAYFVLDSRGWRYLTLLASVPPVLSLLFLGFLDESPSWLLAKGRAAEAETIMDKIAKTNRSEMKPFKLEDEEEHHASMTDLFKPKYLLATVCVWLTSFAQTFCYYGIILFLPRVLHVPKSERFPFKELIYSCLGEIGGTIIGVFMVDFLSRGMVCTVSFLVFGLALPLLVTPNVPLPLVFAMIARAAAPISGSASWLLSAEAYPVEIRATGHSYGNMIARIGAFLTTYWGGAQLSATHLAYGYTAVSIIGALGGWFNPKAAMALE